MPWLFLDDPIVRYGIQQNKLIVHPTFLLKIYITLSTVLGLWAIVDGNTIMVQIRILILMAGIFSLLAHIHLLVGIISRTGNIISVMRQRGDWELFILTSIDKSRWLIAQGAVISWQVYPLVRQIVSIHAISSIPIITFVIASQESLNSQSGIKVTCGVLMLTGYIFHPFFSTGLFIATSIKLSTGTANIERVFVKLLGELWITRTITGGLALVVVFMYLIALSLFSNVLGISTEEISDFWGTVGLLSLFVCTSWLFLLCCVVLVLIPTLWGLIWDWMPLFAILVFTTTAYPSLFQLFMTANFYILSFIIGQVVFIAIAIEIFLDEAHNNLKPYFNGTS